MLSTLKNKITTDTLLLLIIFITAAILRFWNYDEIPFMHDELSALERTKYTNLQDEINYGVAIYDTHPAGVQLFIYYWIKVFGKAEMSVKLPFILFGLFSIFIAYKVSKFWFNSSVGLITAAFMAVMQYMVMYSQIARPYIPGVFFSLLMVWYWSKFFFDQNINHKNKYLLGYIISSALCAYTHHFALLFAAIAGFTGIFFISKSTWKAYLIAGVSIFILYIPHLRILFFQLNKGGLGGPDGWLAAPESDWFSRYLKYLFHYSYWMYAMFFILLALSIFYHSKELKQKQKFRVIALSWFLLVFFIEYYYSLMVNPIIQYSTLIFVFPFLLMFLFSLFAELNRNIKIITVFTILITGTLTLIFNRNHFQVFYKQPYQEQVLNTYEILNQIKDEKNVTIELMIPPYYKEYYFKKYNRRFESVFYNAFDTKPDNKKFRTFVQNQTTDYFIAGNLPLEYHQIIKEKYPFMIHKEEGFTYYIQCFSKNKPQEVINEKIIFSIKGNSSNLDGKDSRWQGNLSYAEDPENPGLHLSLDSTQEYSIAFTSKLTDIANSKYNIINVSVDIKSWDSTANPILVLTFSDKEETLAWHGAEYSRFNNDPKEFNKIHLSQFLTAVDFKKHPDAKITVYIWNKNKKFIWMDNISIEILEGNPVIFGLYEPID